MVAPVGRHLNGWCNQRGGGRRSQYGCEYGRGGVLQKEEVRGEREGRWGEGGREEEEVDQVEEGIFKQLFVSDFLLMLVGRTQRGGS